MSKKSLAHIIDHRHDELLRSPERLILEGLRSIMASNINLGHKHRGFGITEVKLRNNLLQVTAPPHVKQYLAVHQTAILEALSAYLNDHANLNTKGIKVAAIK